MQDKDLSEYTPLRSSTSKHLSCNHQLCELGPNCKSSKQPCPYIVNYYSENTSSSGFLVEDTLHLGSGGDYASNTFVGASVIIGCGRQQSGGYLNGIAPDGLMGLGLGEISVPSFLAKAGLVCDSFSLCFNEDLSGRIFFGDQGSTTQQSTPFLPLNGKYETYIVGVNLCCIGNSCLEQTRFKALVDSGSSFTFLPFNVYKRVVEEFDKQVNATRTSYEEFPWEYCYKSSSLESLRIPSVSFVFALNSSFTVHNPISPFPSVQGVVFCLTVQPTDDDIGMIGQDFMTGYRMVFDRENLTLGWSSSDCQDLSNNDRMPPTPVSNEGTPNPLPTNEQQRNPRGQAVPPAVAGRAPFKTSAALKLHFLSRYCLLVRSLLLLNILIMAL